MYDSGEETEAKKNGKKAHTDTFWHSLTLNVEIARSFRFIIDRYTLVSHWFVRYLQQKTLGQLRVLSIGLLTT
jgi:hypothetical protein